MGDLGANSPMRRGSVIVLLMLIALSAAVVAYVSPVRAGAVAFPAQACLDYGANPVLNDSQPFPNSDSSFPQYATHYDYPSVLNRGGLFTMWFSGAVANLSGIFTASSTDGISWNVRSSPVVAPGTNGTWDEQVYSPNVVWNGTMYLMYYTGTGTNSYRQIGLAYSTDNLHWSKYPNNPIIVAGPQFYDSWWGRFPDVILDRGVYKMWYTGHTLTNTSTPWYIAVDYANSTDGVHWNKYAGNPVFAVWPGASGADAFFSHPSVVKLNGSYLMVSDDYTHISYATSPDGINWTASNSDLISPTGSTTWVNGTAWAASALVNGSDLLVWYWGTGYPSGGYVSGIALAKCSLVLVSSTTTVSVTNILTTTATSTARITQTTTKNTVTTQFLIVTTPPDLTTTYLEAIAGVVAAAVAGAVISWFLFTKRPPPA